MKIFHIIVLVFGFSLTSLANADEVQIDAAFDAGLIDQLQDNNLGAHTHVPVGQANNASVRRSLFFMDISASVPAGSTIDSVTFEFDVTKQGGPQGQQGATVEIHRVTNAWTEGTGAGSNGSATGDGATWINRTGSDLWTTSGGDFAAASSGSTFVDHVADGGGTITYSLGNAQLISDVQDMLDNAGSNFGFMLRANNEGLVGSAMRVTARENANGSLGTEARLIIGFSPPGGDVVATSFMVTRGQYVSGGLPELAVSDNMDLSIRRLSTDTQSRTEFEVKSTSPTASPSSFKCTLEGAVFARSNVIQTIDLYDYAAAAWELVDTRDAARSPSPDLVVTYEAMGDLSRFVEAGTMFVEARVRYKSESTPRQNFASNTDQFIWTIGQ